MTLDQIKNFCAQGDVRYWINHPWFDGEYVVATNGHIAIRVAVSDEFSGVGPCLDAANKYKIVGVIEKAKAASVELLNIPELPAAVSCEICGGSGKAYKCTSCDGDGEFDHDGFDYECKPCNGTGQVDETNGSAGGETSCQECGGSGDQFGQAVQVGDAYFQRRYLALIAGLGNGKVAPAGNGIAYWTADGCDGALMPRRKP